MAICMLNMGTSASTDSDLPSAQKEDHRLDLSERGWSGFNRHFIFVAWNQDKGYTCQLAQLNG